MFGFVCYDSDSRPPLLPGAAAPLSVENLPIITSTGARIAAVLARPDAPTGVPVLVLPDNHGLAEFPRSLATRLAGRGHVALAIDYIDRERPAAPAAEDVPFVERFVRFSDRVMKDVLPAAVARLRATAGRSLVALGCCLGGRFAFLAAARALGLVGAIGLYGGPQSIGTQHGPTALADRITAPVLALFGGADDSIPPAAVSAFAAALSAAGMPHEVVVYPDAPHGFFEDAPAFGDAAADAWHRILIFLDARAADAGVEEVRVVDGWDAERAAPAG